MKRIYKTETLIKLIYMYTYLICIKSDFYISFSYLYLVCIEKPNETNTTF